MSRQPKAQAGSGERRQGGVPSCAVPPVTPETLHTAAALNVKVRAFGWMPSLAGVGYALQFQVAGVGFINISLSITV